MAKVSRIRTREVERPVGRQTNFLIVFLAVRDNSKQIDSHPFIRSIGRGDFTRNAKAYAKQIFGRDFNPAKPISDIDAKIKAIEELLLNMIVKNKPNSNRGESFQKRLFPWIWLNLKKQGKKLPTKGGLLSAYAIIAADDTVYNSYCFSESLDRNSEEIFTKTIIDRVSFITTTGVEDYIKSVLMKKK